MRNPFQAEPLPPESEADAGALFSELSTEELSPSASASIRGSMQNALAATRSAVGHSGRFVLASSAVMLPLVALGAVGAASGESPVATPVALFEGAATSLGIVSAEEPEANEAQTTLAQAPATNLAPSANTGTTGTTAAPSPNLSGVAQAQEGEEGEEGEVPDNGTDDGDAEDGEGPAAAAVAAHEDGNGCDDVLFGAGEPPFATPGGPVGCEVGNSGDHRQNGANHEEDDGEDDGDTGEETPDEDDTGDEDDAEEEGNGGVSRGLGRGHDEDRPGNGNGFGHDKHGHEPNTNGHGPGGPNADDGDDDGDGDTEPEPAAADSAPNSPGNSGNAPGQQKKGGKKN